MERPLDRWKHQFECLDFYTSIEVCNSGGSYMLREKIHIHQMLACYTPNLSQQLGQLTPDLALATILSL